MLKSAERTALELPIGVTHDSVIRSLELGHGYMWMTLTRNPVRVTYGSSRTGNMPELLILGARSLLLSGGDDVYIERIQRVLEMLSRQNHTTLSKMGGVSSG